MNCCLPDGKKIGPVANIKCIYIPDPSDRTIAYAQSVDSASLNRSYIG